MFVFGLKSEKDTRYKIQDTGNKIQDTGIRIKELQ